MIAASPAAIKNSIPALPVAPPAKIEPPPEFTPAW
jgi:hypothetical protein